MPFTFKTFAGAALTAALIAPLPAAAQDAASGELLVELNSAADLDTACRLIFVARNQSETSLDLAAFQIAVFDTDGQVTRLLRLDFPGVLAGRTKVFQFDLRDTQCSSMGEFIVNDTLQCDAADGAETDLCTTGLSASSRTEIKFGI